MLGANITFNIALRYGRYLYKTPPLKNINNLKGNFNIGITRIQ